MVVRRVLSLPLQHTFFVLAALAVLMGSIDGNIMTVALPQLEAGLEAPLAWIGWTLTIYQLVQIVMFPLAGKLSDALGRRRVFVFFVATFTAASVLCALAPNVGLLIVFRALQAVGGGGLLPSAIGIVSEQYQERRMQAIGLITSAMPMGSIVGPNIGGFLLEVSSWRSLFWVNVPIGIAIVLGVLLVLPRSKRVEPRPALDLDVLGLGLYATAIVLLMLGMTLVANDPALLRSPLVWALVAASLVLGVVFVWHVRRARNPVMEYALLARNPFLASNVYNFFFGAVTMGFFSFIPYFAVVRYGFSPFESGALLTPRAFIVVITSILCSVYVLRIGYRVPLLLSGALVVATFLLLVPDWSHVQVAGVGISTFWMLAAVLSVGGVGMGLSIPVSNNVSIDLAPHKAAAISGIRGTFRLTGGAVSVAAVVTALSFFPNPATGLTTIFLALAVLTVLVTPRVFLIPDTARQRRLRAQAAQAPAGPSAAPLAAAAEYADA